MSRDEGSDYTRQTEVLINSIKLQLWLHVQSKGHKFGFLTCGWWISLLSKSEI